MRIFKLKRPIIQMVDLFTILPCIFMIFYLVICSEQHASFPAWKSIFWEQYYHSIIITMLWNGTLICIWCYDMTIPVTWTNNHTDKISTQEQHTSSTLYLHFIFICFYWSHRYYHFQFPTPLLNNKIKSYIMLICLAYFTLNYFVIS